MGYPAGGGAYQQGGMYQPAGSGGGYQPAGAVPGYQGYVAVQPQSTVVVVGGCPSCRVSEQKARSLIAIIHGLVNMCRNDC